MLNMVSFNKFRCNIVKISLQATPIKLLYDVSVKSKHFILGDNINENDNLVNMTLSEYLNKILSDRNLKTSDLVKLTGLDRTYTYQIMSGRKNPSRDKVIAICFALNMSFEDTQQLLKATGYPILYARFQRDSIIIFALQHNASLTDTNELLYDYNFDTLT